MAYDNACFISYKHPPGTSASGHFWLEFVTAFERKLRSYINVDLPIYRDAQLRERPGVPYPQELARNLCASACMIAIMVPEYIESSWCRAEWTAMEGLARNRCNETNDPGLIIPILFRGDQRRAEEFASMRTVIDLSHVQRPSSQLDTVRNRTVIENIGERVTSIARSIGHDGNCAGFEIAVGDDESVVVETGPDPFA